MTTGEVLASCLTATAFSLTRLQQRIGFPREQSLGGPLMQRIAEAAAESHWKGKPLRNGPWFVLSGGQIEQLSAELGRPILNSGDILFGIMLVVRVDRGEECEFEELTWMESHGGYVDCREPLA